MSDDLTKRLLANGLDECDEAAGRIEALQAENERLREALEWYGEQARLCRLVHSEGDNGRHALSRDGGEIARAALSATQPAAEPLDMTRPGDVEYDT